MSKWATFRDILLDVAPKVLPFTPLAAITPFVQAGILEAKAMTGASNAEKLAHAVTIARNGIAATNAAEGRIVIDPEISDAMIGHGISTVYEAAKLVHQAHEAQPAA